jgi:pectate disaccharide-lyase
MKRCRIPAVVFYSLLLVSSLVFLGCEVGSSDSATRTMNFNVTGIYRNTDTNANNGKLISDNSGSPITQLNLRQTGDLLEGNDNNGKIFTGTIGDEGDFTMTGLTTAGTEGTMTGTIGTSGDQATMRGTWIEPSLYGTIYGVATVPTNSAKVTYSLTVNVSPSGAGGVTLNPSGGIYNSGTEVSLTATANTGHTFSSWSGDLSGTVNPNTIIMNGDKSVTANFN